MGAEVSVSHKDIFLIVNVIHVLHLVEFLLGETQEGIVLARVELQCREVLRRHVGIALREGHRQASARIHQSGQGVGNRVSGFLSRLPYEQYGIDHILPGGGLNHSGHVEHHGDILVLSVEGGAYRSDELQLVPAQQEIVLEMAVRTFTAVAAYGDYCRFRIDGGLFCKGFQTCLRHFLCLFWNLVPFLAGIGLVHAGIFGCRVFAVGQIRFAVEQYAVIRESLVEIDNVCLVDVARTGPACAESVRGLPEECGAAGLCERQGGVLVLKQHEAFGRLFTRQLGVCGEVRPVAVGISPEARSLYYESEYIAYAGVEFAFRQAAVADGLVYGLVLPVLSRLQHIVAGVNLCRRVLSAAPVGHNAAFVAPVAPEHPFQQFRVLGGIYAVEVVVGGHYRPWGTLAQCDFPVAQIELAQGPHAHPGVAGQAVDLAVVHREVLEGCAHSVGLNAVYEGGGHCPGEQRVL